MGWHDSGAFLNNPTMATGFNLHVRTFRTCWENLQGKVDFLCCNLPRSFPPPLNQMLPNSLEGGFPQGVLRPGINTVKMSDVTTVPL